MLGPASDSLLSRLLFSIANFSSTEIIERMPIHPGTWGIMLASVVFIAGRSMYARLVVAWTPPSESGAVGKDIVVTFADTNWTVFMYVIVQWGVDLFELWWAQSESVAAGIAVTEVPILLTQALVISVGMSTFGSRCESKPTIAATRAVLDQLSFSISFFFADRISALIRTVPAAMEFVLAACVFVAWHLTFLKVFELWAPRSTQDASLKEIFYQNVSTIDTSGVLVLTSMFVSIFHLWWLEGEHWLVTTSLFLSILFLVLGLVAWFKEYSVVDEQTRAAPDAVINRATFSMAMFMANSARATGSFADQDRTIWSIIWAAVAFIMLNVGAHHLLDAWEARLAARLSDLDSLSAPPPASSDAIRALRASTRGQRVLKNTIDKFVTTWMAIITVFVTRWLVDIFTSWWKNESNLLVSITLVEAAMLLLVSLVKMALWAEGHYRTFAKPGALEYGLG